MGLLGRLFGPHADSPDREQRTATIMGGDETLEVVGESFHQEELWQIVGGRTMDRVPHPVVAVLEPEPTNPEDSNAVQVLIDGSAVGHLSRNDAFVYKPGLERLRASHGTPIALRGQVVGGGLRERRLGMLGVFLDHEPSDFGLHRTQTVRIGELRTGLSQAVATDVEDDTYDLSWYAALSGNYSAADTVLLRKLLDDERDPIDRHFMLVELAKCLYKSRDAFASALTEFDAVCEQHHEEMAAIRVALVCKFGSVPVLDLYRQAAIRCQKTRDWERMRTWAERGLDVYGTEPARPEAVADLQKRLALAESKLAEPAKPKRGPSRAGGGGGPAGGVEVERLVCTACGSSFQRARTRGRKPLRCPACRQGASL